MDFSRFKLTGQAVHLNQLQTNVDDGQKDKELKKRREKLHEEIAELQQALYAESKQSLLVVLQAMDAAGKDSTIEKLTRGLDAHNVNVESFKAPSKQELSHDFLWRVHKVAPQAGDITVFNRSHYEDVLIVKVHGWATDEKIEHRYQHINNFEALLADRGTKVLKFMLNVSPEYQLERFKSRLERPEKNWKFNPGDIEERKHWDSYMKAFEVALQRCASEQAPWYVVPAENRYYRDVMIATIVRDTLKQMNCQYPEPDYDHTLYTVDSLR